jgi:hypothetical protein
MSCQTIAKKGSKNGSLMTYRLDSREVDSGRSELGQATMKGKSFWWV